MDNTCIHVVGGLYREECMRPGWREIYGSAGRAASAIAAAGGKACLHGYADTLASDNFLQRAALEQYKVNLTDVADATTFQYVHGLGTPTITTQAASHPSLTISQERVVRFGMLEGDAVVHANFAVYDPQNVSNPRHFAENGSTATHLALVLNRYEAAVLSGIDGSPLEMAQALVSASRAQVVIIKLGPQGALVYADGQEAQVPAFRTDKVWKIGSGDTFVANFAHHWMSGQPAGQAAILASRATAYYCQFRGFATPGQLAAYWPTPVELSARCLKGYRPKVYLAGPFFTLAQLWLVEQAREQLHALGLDVFSPYHDVGHASANDVAAKDLAAIDNCDVLFAIADGLDSGTMYEIGHAQARQKSVVIYCENEADNHLKMMVGAGCIVSKDYVSAIYQTLWTAIEL
ncbi:PfkB family carbohydrate kinase [Pseudoduganella aquatica]|uniref:PfkB family carbohydrate kinase n=1 Tax=Pseudoduganella aquatica TaxID=2660641 RepID=UPI001E47CAD5|nr:PfkB family carbohydrate kinase [Pseudoduganella aquatica]